MARRNYNQGNGLRPEVDNEETGEPVIPVVDEAEGEYSVEAQEDGEHRQRVIGDAQYERDDSDRALSDREHDEREVTDAERLELFRLSLFQNQLPQLPKMPGYHLCWLTTSNPRDSIQGRLRLGYKLIKVEEIPGWEHSAVASGQYAGCVGVNEMIAAKLPLHLYEMYMTEAHHNQPLAEEGKLRATLDAIKDQAQSSKARLIEEDGTAALGTKTRRAKFEEVSRR